MGQSERSLMALGKHVAGLQDQAPEALLDRERGRARLFAEEIAPAPLTQRPRAAARFGAPLAAALALAALVVVLARRRDPVRFDLGATAPGVVGAWIAAPPEAELPIRFSDGSVLHLARGGRARVAAVDENGAEVALERGSLDLSVVHRPRTRWTVQVGPFQVHVIGTRFETHWDPMTEQFGVALREGAITVSGPVVGEGRIVRAGERLTVSPATGTLEVGAIPTADHEGPEPRPEVTSSAPSAAQSVARIPTPPPAGGATSPPPASSLATMASSERALVATPAVDPEPAPAAASWRALAVDARYKEALAAAEREGFDGICAAASSADLRALGDAARLGGSAGRAVQAFVALRRRFPGSSDAASAAFIMGRIAQDQSRDDAGAAGWFSRYLAEQPGGAFAADALGRLVEAMDRQGDAASARRTAERYLAAYPGGPHAGYAKRVLAHLDASAP